MLRLSLRNLLAHKVRAAMTTFAIVLGVGFVVGAFVVTDSLRRSVDTLFTEITGGVDVTVQAETDIGAGANGPVVRGRLPIELVDTIARVPGVEVAEGAVGGYAQLLDLDGEPVTTTGAPFIGVAWGNDPRLRPVTLAEGREPHGAHEAVIDRATANDYGFQVGDRTDVLVSSGDPLEVEIVGIFTFGKENNLLGARLTAFDLDVADDLLGVAGEVDSINIAASNGVDEATLVERVQDVLPAGVEAITGTAAAEDAKSSMSGFIDLFRNVLLGFAAIALFVSAYFINNTFSIVVGQRTRELALLRAIGASASQIRASVALEAIAIGVLASALGIGAGMAIALGLQTILGAAGFDLPAQGLVLAARSIVAAAVVGIGVTTIAALQPAHRAAGVSAIEGMRGVLPSHWTRAQRSWTGIALVAAGAVAMVVGLFVVSDTLHIVGLLGAGAIAVFTGVSELSPVAAVPLAGALGRPIAPLFRVAGKLAHANAVRNPDRTAKTASALTIGLALVTMVFVVGTSMKVSFADSIERSVSADFILSTESFTGFSPSVTDELGELPGIDAVTGVRLGRFRFEGNERDLVAVDADAATEVVDIDLLSGDPSALDRSSIFIHEDPARDLGLDVGDSVDVELATGGPRQLTVSGIYADSTYAGNYLVDMALFAEYYPTADLDMMAFAKVDNDADLAAVRADIEAMLATYPQVKLEDRAEFRADQEAQFNSLLVAINGLLGLALLIALLGIGNTLALSVLERTNEIGLLRAVGMLRRQTREMILAESAMVAVFGAALGVLVGTAFGLAATAALPESVVTTTAIPFGTISVIVLIAAVCGVVAGLVPARRAARLDVLRAIATD